jgi:hypothetical protein
MIKTPLIVIALSVAAAAAFAQTSTPADAASAPAKHKMLKKLRNHKPGAPASDPERSADKKGGA